MAKVKKETVGDGTRERMRRVNVVLSAEVLAQVGEIARAERSSRSIVIRRLIREAYGERRGAE